MPPWHTTSEIDYLFHAAVSDRWRDEAEACDAYGAAVAEIVTSATLPWWAFYRRFYRNHYEHYAVRYARLGALYPTMKHAYGCGADPEQIRALHTLIFK